MTSRPTMHDAVTEVGPLAPRPNRRPNEADLRALPAAMVATGLVWLGPYFAWTSGLYFRGAIAAATLLFVLAVATNRIRLSRENLVLAGAFVLLMLYYTAHTPGRLFDPSSGWLALVLFVLMQSRAKGTAFEMFRYVFAVCLIPAIVVWVLSAVGVDVPWSYLYARRFDAELLTGIEGAYYRQYLGSVVRNTDIIAMGFGTVFRVHGMFEEPGVVGTISGLLLVAGQARIRRRPENVIILIGGLLSFSLAFYAIMYAYLLFRRPVATAVCTAVLLLVGTIVVGLTDQLSFLSAFLLSRLVHGSNVFSDASRVSPEFQSIYAEFWRSDLSTRLFGSPSDISDLVSTGSFSYKVVVFQYGIVGFAALIAALSAASIAISRRKDALALLAFVLISMLQRPNVFSLPYAIILLGGAAVIEGDFLARRTATAIEASPTPLSSAG